MVPEYIDETLKCVAECNVGIWELPAEFVDHKSHCGVEFENHAIYILHTPSVPASVMRHVVRSTTQRSHPHDHHSSGVSIVEALQNPLYLCKSMNWPWRAIKVGKQPEVIKWCRVPWTWMEKWIPIILRALILVQLGRWWKFCELFEGRKVWNKHRVDLNHHWDWSQL